MLPIHGFVARGFEVDDQMIADFKTMLATDRIKVDADAFAKDIDFIRAMIRYDIDLALFGVEEARRRLIADDPQAEIALGQFPEATRLSENARRTRAQARREGR